jgi:enoyl-CoA hydratase/carnithine racemase
VSGIMADGIIVAKEGGVLTLTIDRLHKKNAITAPMYAALALAIADAGEDADIGAILIQGQPGVFSAGNDIAEFMAFATSGSLGEEVLAFLQSLAICGKPLVAGVDGLAIGVGVTMLFHCDYVVASDRSTFQTPFVNLGLVPEAASSLLAPRLMGHHRAFEMLAMGRKFDAARARECGFVNEIVSAEALPGAAMAAANEIAAKPREAIAIARNLVRRDSAPVLDRIDEEARLFGERLRSAEARQAFMAFLAKKS